MNINITQNFTDGGYACVTKITIELPEAVYRSTMGMEEWKRRIVDDWNKAIKVGREIEGIINKTTLKNNPRNEKV